MRYVPLILRFLAAGLLMLALAPAASAQATRTWVSGVGDDANPCSRTAPCKTFAGAISKTAAGGLINVLDPGGFGAVTITKSITIDGGSEHAGVLVSGTNGINVNGAGIKVILRNLSIEGVGFGLIGVNFTQGSQLTVERCNIFGFQSGTAHAIHVAVGASAKVMVKDTNITDNGTGIHLQTSSGQLLATLDNVRIEGMGANGLQTAGPGAVFVTVRHSVINQSAGEGVYAGNPLAVVNLVDNAIAFNNGTAVHAAAPGSRIRISGNTIVNNNIALGIASGAFIESGGDNQIAGFSASVAPNAVLNMQ